MRFFFFTPAFWSDLPGVRAHPHAVRGLAAAAAAGAAGRLLPAALPVCHAPCVLMPRAACRRGIQFCWCSRGISAAHRSAHYISSLDRPSTTPVPL
jgi:hypothetical protein